MPTNRYTKKMPTRISIAMSFTFFHHIFLRSPRLLTRKSRALPPSRSVLSTSKSIRSPLSRTLSMFSVMISRTPSISRCTFRIASFFPASVVPRLIINFFNVELNAAHPYAGCDPKSVELGAYCEKNWFLISTRKPTVSVYRRLLSLRQGKSDRPLMVSWDTLTARSPHNV